MAKQISILKAGGAIPYADGGLKLSKSIALDQIEAHPDFQGIFKIDPGLLERITESIRENGFDNSQPLHIWKCREDEGTAHLYLIDGYTRWKALLAAGAESAPYFEHNFGTKEEAYRYALSLQVNRRNLSDGELIKNVQILLESGFIKSIKGKKSAAIAEVLGTSARTVEKAISVAKDADEETLSKIDSGEMTLNQTYNGKQKRSPTKKKTDGKDSGGEDILSSSEGNPAPLNFNHSDGIERPHRDPWELSERDKILHDRFQEGYKEGLSDGFAKGAYAVYAKIFELVDGGKSVDEIRGDELFEDFSAAVITKKFPEENIG